MLLFSSIADRALEYFDPIGNAWIYPVRVLPPKFQHRIRKFAGKLSQVWALKSPRFYLGGEKAWTRPPVQCNARSIISPRAFSFNCFTSNSSYTDKLLPTSVALVRHNQLVLVTLAMDQAFLGQSWTIVLSAFGLMLLFWRRRKLWISKGSAEIPARDATWEIQGGWTN